MSDKVRVRFAPSPTGPLHIGGVRTALYNYLFARHFGGQMILRIEDTDSRRFVPGAEQYIIEAMDWLGIRFDEGVANGGPHAPYRQSERRDIYRKYATQLIDDGRAYIAFDTPEELDAARAATPNFQYDASTRMGMTNSLTLSEEEVRERIGRGDQYVVRIKIEPGQDVVVDDLVRGKVTINSSILDDKVLYKSADDLPTYHLANIVDDHLMEVTHVIRGEEWLPSAPLHVLLYRALGWEDTMPRFAHLPLLLKPVGNGKLSKRDGSASVSMYREKGYAPACITEYVMTLLNSNYEEWRAANPEKPFTDFPFSIKKMSASGALFDPDKLYDVCKNTVSRMTAAEVYDGLAGWAREYDADLYACLAADRGYAERILNMTGRIRAPRSSATPVCTTRATTSSSGLTASARSRRSWAMRPT